MTGVDVAAIRARCEWLLKFRGAPSYRDISDAYRVLEHDVPALLDALAEAEQQRDDALATVARVEALAAKWEANAGPGSKAWMVYGSQTVSVPFAVKSVRAALADPRPPASTPAAEPPQPRVPGTTGPQNPAQGREA